MSLQTKILSLIFIVFLAYGSIDFGLQRLVILPSFLALEQEEALKDMDRAVQAINREIEQLAEKAADWATWDDTYKFMQDQNEGFRENVLHDNSLVSLKVNLIYIFNTGREPLWGLIYDLEGEEEIRLPEIPELLAISAFTQPDSKKGGLLITEKGPILVSTRPILTSNGDGPSRGNLMMGQFLNDVAIGKQTRLNIKTTVIGKEKIDPEEAAIASEIGVNGKALIRNIGNNNRVYSVMADIFGNPALLLRIEIPKAISARGADAVHVALLSFFGIGLIILVVLLVAMHRMVINPLKQMNDHAVVLGRSSSLSERLSFTRRDEIGKLANEFDRMVDQLSEARNALVEQSYHSGIAEMASGVLHNIGNSITPLSIKVTALINDLRQAPLEEIAIAATELETPATPEERRTDLSKFVELAGIELADQMKRATGELEKIRNQVNHVELILADQRRFSLAQRLVDTVDIHTLLKQSVDLQPESVRKSIDMDPSIEEAGEVQISQVAFQQVFSNLLINAAESIREFHQSTGNGRIRIRGAKEVTEGIPMAHLFVEDNGAGIESEKLAKIFERGFSTKARGSGLGLHWSANTMAAMKGRLYAESQGRDKGAVFHILIPLRQAGSQTKEISV